MKLSISERNGLLVVKFGPENDKASLDEARLAMGQALQAAKSRGIRKILMDLKDLHLTYEDVGLILPAARDVELTLVLCGLNGSSEAKLKMLGLDFFLKGPTFPDVETAIAALAA